MSNTHLVDKHVGLRVRQRRIALGISQEALGNACSVTFQQIQKYERGINRVSASRLYEFARVLRVPVGFFFEDLPETELEVAPDEPPPTRADLEFARLLKTIKDPVARTSFLHTARNLARQLARIPEGENHDGKC
jgi:transcriptional regulator with XRE-family HTH domain